MEKGQVNTAAMWAVMTLITGSGTVLYPDLATTEELSKLETRQNLRIDAFSGGVYELFLESVNESIVKLEGTVVKTQEQNQTLFRLRIRKEKLLRVLTQELAR